MEKFYPYQTSWYKVNKIYPKPPNLFSIGIPFRDENGKPMLKLSTRIKWYCPSTGETLVVKPETVVAVRDTTFRGNLSKELDEPFVTEPSSGFEFESFPICKSWEVWSFRHNFLNFDILGLRECELITYARRHKILDAKTIDSMKSQIGCNALSKILFELMCS